MNLQRGKQLPAVGEYPVWYIHSEDKQLRIQAFVLLVTTSPSS